MLQLYYFASRYFNFYVQKLPMSHLLICRPLCVTSSWPNTHQSVSAAAQRERGTSGSRPSSDASTGTAWPTKRSSRRLSPKWWVMLRVCMVCERARVVHVACFLFSISPCAAYFPNFDVFICLSHNWNFFDSSGSFVQCGEYLCKNRWWTQINGHNGI